MLLRVLPFLLLYSIAYASEPAWYLFARDDGCIDLQMAARKLKLPRTPMSPEDFAQMQRDRGENVVVAPSPLVSSNLPGKIVQVQFGAGKSWTFLSAEACRAMEGGKSR